MSYEVRLYREDGVLLGAQLVPDGHAMTLSDVSMPVGRVEVVSHPDTPPAPEPPPDSPEFLALVLAWLRSQGYPQAVSVEHVTGDGSDWNGDTEGGFYSSFSVDIEWRDDTGAKRYYTASGDDMESLWTYVVRSWPAEGPSAGTTPEGTAAPG